MPLCDPWYVLRTIQKVIHISVSLYCIVFFLGFQRSYQIEKQERKQRLVGLIVSRDPVFDQDSSSRAQGYVGLYLIMHQITMWGVGWQMISLSAREEMVYIYVYRYSIHLSI